MNASEKNIAQTEKKGYEVQYYTVKNHEEQYSIWPTYKPIPKGWEAVGEAASKENCLSYVEKVWTDMRPLSLRKQMEALEMKIKSKKNDEVYNKESIKVTK